MNEYTQQAFDTLKEENSRMRGYLDIWRELIHRSTPPDLETLRFFADHTVECAVTRVKESC